MYLGKYITKILLGRSANLYKSTRRFIATGIDNVDNLHTICYLTFSG